MMELERQSPAAAHWSPQQFEDLFLASETCRYQRFAWVVEDAESPPASVPSEPRSIIGFLVAHRVDAEWELENIVVAEEVRRRGFGMLLLHELIVHAKAEHGVSLFLEVRESNRSARSLYRRAGFEETGLRKGYYSGPPEDAILCRLRLC
jgi:ribosomal-protein-alanine N-acetyltransferase